MSYARALCWAFVLVSGLGMLASCSAEAIDSCGLVFERLGCLVFASYDGEGLFGLPETLDVDVPGEYHLRGVIEILCGYCGTVNCLIGVEVAQCEPEDFGCGVLMQWEEEGAECYVWRSISDQEGYLVVDGFDGYADGDTVNAIGVLDRGCIPICSGVEGCLYHTSFAQCSDSASVISRVSWGKLRSIFRK